MTQTKEQYDRRLKQIAAFERLNAPRSVVIFACEHLIRCEKGGPLKTWWWLTCYYIQRRWEYLMMDCRFFYYRKILRLSEDDIEGRICGDAD